ncbi:hypothetical protein BDV12DRAFT_200008 [Aspergillus spectabilis]
MRFTLQQAFPYILLYTSFFSSSTCADTKVNVVSRPIHNSSEVGDLISFLKSRAQNQDESFTQATELLESIKLSSPSCNQVAASKLITSCESIGRKPDISMDSDTYLALENVRSLYAARLAVCELSGAGASTPSPCRQINAPPGKQKRGFDFFFKHNAATVTTESVPREVLEPCLKSLESRPQWWTSYSNNRQNAVVICQAARIENEKDEILELYNTILKSSINLSDALQAALRVAAEESSSHRAFVHSTELLREEMLREAEESTSSFKRAFGRVSQELETSYRSVIEGISSALGSVHTGVMKVEKNLQNSSSEADHLRQMLQSIHEETLLRSEEIASTQQQNAATHNDLALSLQYNLQSIAQYDIAKLAQNIETFDESLEWLYAKVALILQQEESVSERLRTINSSLDEFQLRIDSLHEIQQRQYETAVAQSQLQEVLHTNMRISKELLDQTASTAANLQTMIDETTSRRLFDSPILGRLFGTYSPWAACAIFSSLLVGLQNPRNIVVFLMCLLCYAATTVL